ncbi:MAG: hypothetical protein Q9188_004914 [Gyalolechia gomerana]
MAATEESSSFILPKVPVPHEDFVSSINRKDGDEVQRLLEPYNELEAKLREGFAQNRDHPSLLDPHVNAVPIFNPGEGDAIKKVEQIEESVRNAILEEVITVRTKDAVTIASYYPIRHVQIVIRLYKSVSEVFGGFDVDFSRFAFDGTQDGPPPPLSMFHGPLKSVIRDCCGFCPVPKTDEEREVAEGESKIFISGDLKFIKDDPGRQAIKSFNPLTDDGWTEMAYIGNTQELCQRICNGDTAFVKDWCKKNPHLKRRDHTGRTPLHLAAQSSSPEILKCLIDSGARMIARLVNGLSALHIASARGSSEMILILLKKSEANEAEEADKKDRKKAAWQKFRAMLVRGSHVGGGA